MEKLKNQAKLYHSHRYLAKIYLTVTLMRSFISITIIQLIHARYIDTNSDLLCMDIFERGD